MTIEEEYVETIFNSASESSNKLLGEVSADFILGYTRREFQMLLLALDLSEEQVAILNHRKQI